jgi:hypothetical protein
MRTQHRLLAGALAVMLLALPSRSADQAQIDNAIARGLGFLKGQQDKRRGTWPYPEASSVLGATALAGLTLLECDVSSNDPGVLRAADVVRQGSIRLTHTYSLSLAVLFLDRLGDPGDVVLIESMAVRLLAGQNSAGGWSYDCPPISAEEVGRLTTHLRRARARSADVARPPANAGKPRTVSKEILKQLKMVNPSLRPPFSDNSNTKFATLALWIARRHGLPVEAALDRVRGRFRTTQNSDGGWGYLPPGPRERADLSQSSGSMTCAGLLGLGAGIGAAAPEAGAVGQDPAIAQGLALLGKLVGKPIVVGARDPILLFGVKEGDEYYFLWALERVGVAYDLGQIGGQDWYAWGSNILLARQDRDGGWRGKYGAGGIDTCFALLFLRQANLTKDLTVTLKGQVRPPDRMPDNERPGAVPRPDSPPSSPEMKRPTSQPAGDDDSSKATNPPAKPATDAPASVDEETTRLRRALLAAAPAQLGDLLESYKNEKGVAYTQALASAIPRLPGPSKSRARDALAERLGRMTADTLRDRLRDDDAEMRRAAALASAMREERELVPELIGSLGDADQQVARAAHLALKSLSGKDFGPSATASRAERDTAVAAWRNWWKSEKAK